MDKLLNMSELKIKEGADKDEGIRLAFNARMVANQYSIRGDYKLLSSKLDAEAKIDRWLVENIEGIPEKLKDETSDNKM